MEIEGKVILILPLQQGVSKSTGNPWSSQQFVIETYDQYPRKVCIEMFGDNLIKNSNVQIDDPVKVSYDLESREFNGRWYTSVRAWKVEKESANAAAAPATPAPDPFAGGELFPGEGTADPFAA